jgi:hypothetical protein
MIDEQGKGELKLILTLFICMAGLLGLWLIVGQMETDTGERRISVACAAEKEKPEDCLECEKWEDGPHGGSCVDVCPPGKHCTKEGCKGCKGDAPSDCHECVAGKWMEKPGKETECHKCVGGSWVGCEEHEICKDGKCKFDFESLKDKFKEEVKEEMEKSVEDFLRTMESMPPMSPDEFKEKAIDEFKDEALDAIKDAAIETGLEITGIKKATKDLAEQAWEKVKDFMSGDSSEDDTGGSSSIENPDDGIDFKFEGVSFGYDSEDEEGKIMFDFSF